jgi:hypothetical protein
LGVVPRIPSGSKRPDRCLQATEEQENREDPYRPITQGNQHQGRLLFGSLHRHEAHRRPAHCLAKRFGVGHIVLAALHIRIDQFTP